MPKIRRAGRSISRADVFARVWVYDDEPTEVEVWEHAFVPMVGNERSGADWAHEHLSETDLRLLLNLPATGNFQVMITGAIEGCFGHDQEWDEWFVVTKSKAEPVPDSYMNAVTFANRFIEQEPPSPSAASPR